MRCKKLFLIARSDLNCNNIEPVTAESQYISLRADGLSLQYHGVSDISLRAALLGLSFSLPLRFCAGGAIVANVDKWLTTRKKNSKRENLIG